MRYRLPPPPIDFNIPRYLDPNNTAMLKTTFSSKIKQIGKKRRGEGVLKNLLKFEQAMIHGIAKTKQIVYLGSWNGEIFSAITVLDRHTHLAEGVKNFF